MITSKQYSADDYKYYATVSGDKNMFTERPHYNVGPTGGKDLVERPARGFIALTAGDIQIRPVWAGGVAGTDQTFPVAAGTWYVLQFTHIIDAGTTCSQLLVIW